nr:hypothetical protein [Tanacetum cinerariifolium]
NIEHMVKVSEREHILEHKRRVQESLPILKTYTAYHSRSIRRTVEDKILVPKPPKNCARCTRCGYLVDGPNCQGCALLRHEIEENLVEHSPDFQNSSEPSNASTNIVNAPREPYLNITLAKIKDQMTSITSLCELACQVVQKKREEKRIKEEQAAKAQTWKLFDDDNDEERSDSLDDNIISGHPLFSAITPNEPVLSTEEPDNSLSIGDKHLDTIPATESDQFIKFGVENLILIPSESKGIPEHMSFLNDDHSSDFTTKSSSTSHNSLLEETNNFYNSSPEFTTFSNVLCDAECESDSSDDQSCSDEDVLEKIVSKPLSEEEIIPMESLHIRLIEKLLYDNSSPHPPEEFVSDNFNADIESFSPSPIPIKDSDSVMEEIDLVCTPDYLMPPSIKDEDYDSERDILIPKDLPSNNSLSFVEKESFHFDIPLFSRPPAKPPDGDTGIFNIKMMGDISDQKAFMYKLMITLASYQEKSPDLISHR